MSERRSLAPLLACLLIFAAPSGAQDLEDFGPYAASERPPAAPLTQLSNLSRTTVGCNTTSEFGSKESAAGPLFRILSVSDDQKQDSLTIELTQPAPLPDLKLEIPGAFGGYSISSADFNGDGSPDYAIPYEVRKKEKAQGEDKEGEDGGDEETGYGYGYSRTKPLLLFLLSAGNGMTAGSLESSNLETEGLIQLPSQEGTQLIHKTFIRKHGVKPQYPNHRLYFLLYRLVGFDKEGMVKVLEGADARFPKIVSFFDDAVRKNHKETKLLDEAGKKALLEKHPIEITALKPEVKVKVKGKKIKRKTKVIKLSVPLDMQPLGNTPLTNTD